MVFGLLLSKSRILKYLFNIHEPNHIPRLNDSVGQAKTINYTNKLISSIRLLRSPDRYMPVMFLQRPQYFPALLSKNVVL